MEAGNTDRNLSGEIMVMPESGVTKTMGVEWWEILSNVAILWIRKCKRNGGSKRDSGVTDLECSSDSNWQVTHYA